jgi:hypothetical protein
MPLVVGTGLLPRTARQPILPPDPVTPRVSLLSSAAPMQTVGDSAWQANVDARWPLGVAFLPHTSFQAETVDICDGSTANAQYPGGLSDLFPEQVETDYVPFQIEHGENVSTFGYEAFPYVQRAYAGLEAKTASAAEYEFWTGTLSQAKGYPNHYLAMNRTTDTPTAGPVIDLTPSGGAVNPRRALGMLEQALSNAGTAAPSGAQAVVNVSTGQAMGAGRYGMIHCLPEMLANWYGGILHTDGRHLTTDFGTLIVPGSGYPGTGPGGITPAAGQSWLFATSLVYFRVGDPYLADPNFMDHIRRSDNTVLVKAQREVLLYWDHAAHFAIRALLETASGT